MLEIILKFILNHIKTIINHMKSMSNYIKTIEKPYRSEVRKGCAGQGVPVINHSRSQKHSMGYLDIPLRATRGTVAEMYRFTYTCIRTYKYVRERWLTSIGLSVPLLMCGCFTWSVLPQTPCCKRSTKGQSP